ncbi:hypothetical protein IWW50_003234, partial [Coemansia erecta]
NIDANGATIDISVSSGYAPYSKANSCYFSSVVDDKYVVALNGNKACRSIGYNDALAVGSFNGTACLTAFYGGDAHAVATPDVEYLHCTGAQEWIEFSSAKNGGYGLWGKTDNRLCKATVDGVEYLGRGDGTNCFFYKDGGSHWVNIADNASTYLNWLTV